MAHAPDVTGAQVVIERADAADAQAILALQKLAYLSEAQTYNDYSIPPLTQTLDAMVDDLHRQIVLKATSGGRIVGSVRGRLDGGTCYVGRLIVSPELQGRGIGTALLHRIEQEHAGTKRFELFTGDASERNMRLYERLGYRVFSTRRLSDNVTIVLMEKEATPAGGRRLLEGC